MIQIDNKKMWESILSEMLKDDLGLADYIIIALRQQGLKWNDDTKEIVSIEPEKKDFAKPYNSVDTESFKIEAGRWYVCINNKTEHGVISYTEGKLYRSQKDNYLFNDSNMPCSWCVNAGLYFRPATEEEIGRMLDSVKLREKMTVKKDSYPILSNSSNTGKNEKLTEFERILAECIDKTRLCVTPSWEIAVQWSEELLKEARKQIASEINPEADTQAWCIDMQFDGMGDEAYYFKKGIEATIKEIKGE